jgi:hypothetical protein
MLGAREITIVITWETGLNGNWKNRTQKWQVEVVFNTRPYWAKKKKKKKKMRVRTKGNSSKLLLKERFCRWTCFIMNKEAED